MFSVAFLMWKGSTLKSDRLKKWVNPIYSKAKQDLTTAGLSLLLKKQGCRPGWEVIASCANSWIGLNPSEIVEYFQRDKPLWEQVWKLVRIRQIYRAAEITRTHAGELRAEGNGCTVCAINYKRRVSRVCMGDWMPWAKVRIRHSNEKVHVWCSRRGNLTSLWENPQRDGKGNFFFSFFFSTCQILQVNSWDELSG